MDDDQGGAFGVYDVVFGISSDIFGILDGSYDSLWPIWSITSDQMVSWRTVKSIWNHLDKRYLLMDKILAQMAKKHMGPNFSLLDEQVCDDNEGRGSHCCTGHRRLNAEGTR